jgi:hypothetical protein
MIYDWLLYVAKQVSRPRPYCIGPNINPFLVKSLLHKMGSDKKKTYTQLNTLGLLGRKSSSALVLDKKLNPLTINDNLLLPPSPPSLYRDKTWLQRQ